MTQACVHITHANVSHTAQWSKRVLVSTHTLDSEHIQDTSNISSVGLPTPLTLVPL